MAKVDFFPETAVSVDAIKGSRVVASEGMEIGKIADIYINPVTKKVEGIMVGKAREKEYFLGVEFIESLDSDGAKLNITPAEEIIGRKAVDHGGREIGRVKEVVMAADTFISSMVIGRGLGRDDLMVGSSDIESIGEDIVLGLSILDAA